MKNLLVLILFILGIHAAQAEENNSLIGFWQTRVDATNTPRSIIQITEENGELQGKIVKIFSAQGEKLKKQCDLCHGELHNQPIIGLKVLSNLKPKGKEWDDGTILDPDNGELYRCKAYLFDGGKKLHLRGYFGLPLFGKTQIWERVEK